MFSLLALKKQSEFDQVFFSLIIKTVCIRAIIDDKNPKLI